MAIAPTAKTVNLEDLVALGAPADVVCAFNALESMLGSCVFSPGLELKLGFDMSDGFVPLASLEPELFCI